MAERLFRIQKVGGSIPLISNDPAAYSHAMHACMQTCNTQHLHVGSAHMLMLMQCHLAQQDVGAFHSLLGLFMSLLLLLL